MEISSIELLSIRQVANIQVDFFRPLEVGFSSLGPHRNTLIGSMAFNASRNCREVLAANYPFVGDPAHVCYVGFELNTVKGTNPEVLKSLLNDIL